MGLSIYFFLFNLFLIGHGFTDRTLGLITSAMAIGNLAGAIPAGKMAQRFGLRPVLLVCFLLATIVFSARAILLAFYWQISLAFLAGVALSAWAVCISPAVAQLTGEKERPLAFSLIFSLGIGVAAVGGFAGSRLPGWFASHHIQFRALQPDQLVLLLSCCFVAFAIWPVAKVKFTRVDLPARGKPFLSPFLLRFLPAIAVWSLVTGSFSPFATIYFAQHLRMSLPQIGNAFSISQIVQVVAVLIAPFIFKKWGLVSGIVYTQLAASLLLLTLASINHPFAATMIYVGFTAFQWMNEPGLSSLLMNKVPAEERSGASASNTLVISATQAIAATLAGAAFLRYGFPTVIRSIAFVAMIAAALFWSMRAHPHHEASANSCPELSKISS